MRSVFIGGRGSQLNIRIEATALSGPGCCVEDQCAPGRKPSPSAALYATAKEAANTLVLCIRARLYRLRKNSCFVSGHDFSRTVTTPQLRALAPEAALPPATVTNGWAEPHVIRDH